MSSMTIKVAVFISLLSLTTSEQCFSKTEHNIVSGIKSSLEMLERNLLKKKSSICLPGWQPFDKHCYWFSSDTKPWQEAESKCRELGGYLVKVENRKENNWLQKKTKERIQKSTWLGANDFDEKVWKWSVDLTKISFTDWHPTQPDNAKSDEDCLQFYSPFGYKWNDHDCHLKLHYICESNPTYTIENVIRLRYREMTGRFLPYSKVTTK